MRHFSTAPMRVRAMVAGLAMLATATAAGADSSGAASAAAATDLRAAATSQAAAGADVAVLLAQLERALLTGASGGFLDMLVDDPETRDQAIGFLDENTLEGATRVVVHEADRRPLRDVDGGYRLMIELFTERGDQARIASWRFDVRATASPGGEPRWELVDQERLTFIEGLYRLSVDDTTQYRVRNLALTAEDLTITLPEGTAFAVRTDLGTTGLILHGRGTMRFTPQPEGEQTQMEIFAGERVLTAEFNAVFARMNPADYGDIMTGVLTEQPVNRRDLQRAQEMFGESAPESFTLDVGELSPDRWWVIPNFGDFLADVDTRRYDTLTYLHTGKDPEDIKLFDRAASLMLSSYPSRSKLAARGRFYSEDDEVDYDIVDHDIDVAFVPERRWIEGTARLRVRALKNMTSLTIRLADSLAIGSVSSSSFGRLLTLRLPGQNGVMLNLPATLVADTEFDLTVSYSGRLEPEMATHQSIGFRQSPFRDSPAFSSQFPAQQPRTTYLYTNRSYWYPQSKVSDYATATIRVTVPEGYGCVSSGEPQPGSPTVVDEGAGAASGAKRYVFVASRPVRYLATVIGELSRAETASVSLAEEVASSSVPPAAPAGAADRESLDGLRLYFDTNVRYLRDDANPVETATDVVRYYTSLVGDVPYPSLTIALVESTQPGGHSPAYFSLVNEPTQTSLVLWDRDPVYFRNAPEFFLAHEIAHQWWGQAVGWNNYHEQWLSEGFAQYFAALYAHRVHGEQTFNEIVRQMRDWALEHADQGPIYLGYRLGHIQSDEEVFRSVLYNKSAAVLHMLRRLIGDEAFFDGVRQFYADWRFRKAGSEDVRRAFEKTSGRSLERFFEGWVHGADIPELTFSYATERTDVAGEESTGTAAVLRFEQSGPLFDLPITVTLKYESGRTEDVIVRVDDQVTELRVPLTEPLRSAETNRDYAALARIDER